MYIILIFFVIIITVFGVGREKCFFRSSCYTENPKLRVPSLNSTMFSVKLWDPKVKFDIMQVSETVPSIVV